MAESELPKYVRVYDGDLDPGLCRRMIDSFHTLARFQQPNGRGHKAGLDDSAWTELNVSKLSDPQFAAYFRGRINAGLERYNRELPLSIPVPNSPKIADLILKRYKPGGGERFQVHFDSIREHADRYLVFLWYLNDVEAGGETEFPDLGIKVAARAGRLLMFPPYWMFQHAGLPPLSSEKYILSTYLLS